MSDDLSLPVGDTRARLAPEQSMLCTTCGAAVPAARSECMTCGARAARPELLLHTPPAVARVETAPVTCPRCGYRGEGVGYFTRGRHLAALLLLGIVFFPLTLLYVALRYGYAVCPRCGLSWGKHGERAAPVRAGASGKELAEGGAGWRGLTIALAVLAVILIAAGVGEAALTPIFLGLGAGAGAWFSRRADLERREQRRVALLATFSRPVLKLAAAREGVLTVTETAAELGWSMKRAEKVLQFLDDGVRVTSEVTDEGIIVYDFLELRYGPGRLPEGGA